MLSIHFGDSFDGVFTRNNFCASVKINPSFWITRARQKGPKTLTKIYLFYKKPHPQNDNSQKKILIKNPRSRTDIYEMLFDSRKFGHIQTK